MPNIIVAPLDFTALSTAPVEESVWPKSPPTPKEKVGVAAAAAGLPHRPGAMRRQPHQHQRENDHYRPPEPQPHQTGCGPHLPAHGAHVQVIGLREAESPELNPTATPELSAAAVTPAPGHRIVVAGCSRSRWRRRAQPAAGPHRLPPRTSVVPTARPCTRPVP